MKFNARGGISILELFIYFPAIIAAVLVCIRHGFGRSSGWVFTLILCLIRIIGACCQLATYEDQSQGLLEAALILDFVGLSPLLLATVGLLSRCAESINQHSSIFLHALHFRAVQLVITIGLILSIVGGTSSISSTGVYTTQTSSKVGVVLFIVSYVALFLIAALTTFHLSSASAGEKRLDFAVVLALPFILVRLAYSALAVFSHHHEFKLIGGSVAIMAIMSVLMEFIVVFIYLLVGWKTEASPVARQGPTATRLWKGQLTGAAKGAGARRQRQRPIRGLIGLAISAVRPNGQDAGQGRGAPAVVA